MTERLTQTQLLWDGVCERLNHLRLNTARASQLLRHRHSSPQLWLQAHSSLHQQLQVQDGPLNPLTSQWFSSFSGDSTASFPLQKCT